MYGIDNRINSNPFRCRLVGKLTLTREEEGRVLKRKGEYTAIKTFSYKLPAQSVIKAGYATTP
jgi:hypothetical protein